MQQPFDFRGGKGGMNFPHQETFFSQKMKDNLYFYGGEAGKITGEPLSATYPRTLA